MEREQLRALADAVFREEVGAVVVARLCPRCASGGHGRPVVRVASGRAPAVSVSYAPGLIAVAWSHEGPVGVDVEAAGPPVDGIDRREWTEVEAAFKAGGAVPLSALALPPAYVGTLAGGDDAQWRIAGPGAEPS
ncbi:hypothetical protein [Nocardioides flavescens]|uniref:4'-phosphopantetheinyl transferase n=1 Tax=Nocardioides flavescens TaxID=2691959 RepID=A0A6L7EUD1_9ACTN|nr:hypothetical protein [Nocardioides flavescens]MXG91127.1 hypothetical protein [Nocardioides flavescens]